MTRQFNQVPTNLHDSDLEEAVYLISHDLQGPVRALCAIPKWIEEDLESEGVTISPDVTEHFALMKAQSLRLQGMIRDLLTYSRVGRPQPPFDGDWDVFWKSIEGAVPGLSDFDCQVSFPENVPIGAEDIHNLVLSLVSNAVKHHGGTGGSIKLDGHTTDGRWIFTALDDGPGIAEEDRERVKKIFVTLEARDAVEGSGMGLAIADKICTMHGGFLEIDSGPDGSGCLVTANIPSLW